MADVTIAQLPQGIALGQCFLPLSDTIATVKARVSALQVDYSNITSKPTIPAAQVNSDWNASSGVAQILNKPTSAGGINGMSLFSTAGSYTWTVPAGITKVKVTAVGGGGGSGGYRVNNPPSGPGGTTTFALGGRTLTATGGGGSPDGAFGPSTTTGGAGGSASGGDINLAGSQGQYGNANGADGGRAPFQLSICGIGGPSDPSSTPQLGGGGGGSYSTLGAYIGGGGGGGVSMAVITTSPGSVATLTVGAAGQGRTSVNTGASGWTRGQNGGVGCVLLEW